MEKFIKRLAGWKCRSLSFAARVVLINSVLSALPIYFMSIFQVPTTVIKCIDKKTILVGWCRWQKKIG